MALERQAALAAEDGGQAGDIYASYFHLYIFRYDIFNVLYGILY